MRITVSQPSRRFVSPKNMILLTLFIVGRVHSQDVGSFLAGLLGSSEVPQGNTSESNYPPCPGECVHAITSILCNKVIEELYCGASYLRCCVASDFNFGTVVETSAPLPEEETSASDYDIYIVTTESVDNNNKAQSPSPTTETLTNSASTNINTPIIKNTAEDSSIKRPCPGICVEKAFVRYCGTAISYGICDEGFSCCASSSSVNLQASSHLKPTKKPISTTSIISQQSTLNTNAQTISKETAVTHMQEATTSIFVTTPSKPICPGSCVAPLFSLLCDVVKEDFHCPNEGRCCVASEEEPVTTTTEPPKASCPGACIPTFLSGMCNKPGELLVRSDCDENFICCYESNVQNVGRPQQRPLLISPQHPSPGMFSQHPHQAPPVRTPPLQRPYPEQSRPIPIPRPPNNHPYADRPHTRPNMQFHGPPPRPNIYDERPTQHFQEQRPHIPLIAPYEQQRPAKPSLTRPQIDNAEAERKPVENFSPQLSSHSHPDRLTPVRIVPSLVSTTTPKPKPSIPASEPFHHIKSTTKVPQMLSLPSLPSETSISKPLLPEPSRLPQGEITIFQKKPAEEKPNREQSVQVQPSSLSSDYHKPVKAPTIVSANNDSIITVNQRPSSAQISGVTPEREKIHPITSHQENFHRKPPVLPSGNTQSSFIPISFLPQIPPPIGQPNSVRRPPTSKESTGNIPHSISFDADGTPIPVIVKPVPHRHSLAQNSPICPGPCISSFLRFTCFGNNAVYNGFSCAKAGTMCCAPVENIEKYEQTLKLADSAFGGPPDAIAIEQNKSPSTILKDISPYVCGVKGNERRETPRVVGGRTSSVGEWCWQVALINSNNQYLCGGALIGSRWVLTAAHCIQQSVRNGEPIFVRAGDYDLASQYGSPGAQTQKISTSYIHHNHNGQTLDNDIALLRLENPAELSSNVCLVCLPARGATSEPGKRCTVTGYGYQSEKGPIALKVREAVLPIVPDKLCAEQVNNVTEKIFILPTGSFCAGGEPGNDACQGDGGGPLVCENEGFYDLMGLVSWGFGCGKEHVPGVYVKVSSFIGWINQIISVNN